MPDTGMKIMAGWIGNGTLEGDFLMRPEAVKRRLQCLIQSAPFNELRAVYLNPSKL